jgi:adenine phosphoribosyltransferase
VTDVTSGPSGEELQRLVDKLVVDVPDFPQQGVTFKDITPLLDDHEGLSAVVVALAAAGRDEQGNVVVDKVVGIESRGFILGAPVALALGTGFVPVRKAGKLPRETHAVSFVLEYGEATIEMHRDAIEQGERVLIVDDVLATGGTADATRQLVERAGGIPHALTVLLELSFLHGRDAIGDLPLRALTTV